MSCRKKKDPLEQTDPPSIPVDELFPSGEFPEGEIQQYRDEYVILPFILYFQLIFWRSLQIAILFSLKMNSAGSNGTQYFPFLQVNL